jgi:hypothetical protein
VHLLCSAQLLPLQCTTQLHGESSAVGLCLAEQQRTLSCLQAVGDGSGAAITGCKCYRDAFSRMLELVLDSAAVVVPKAMDVAGPT